MGDFDISAQLREAKQKKWDDRTLAQRATELAEELLAEGARHLNSDERTLLSALSRLAADKQNRDFLSQLCAEVLAPAPPQQQAEKLRTLLNSFGGVPTFFSAMGRLRFKAAAMAAHSLQAAAMGEVHRIFRSTFGELCFEGELEKIARRVKEASKASLTCALNLLDPQVFGNKSAALYAARLSALGQSRLAGLIIQPWRLCPELSPFAPETGAKGLERALCALLKGLPHDKPVIVESGASDLLPIIAEGVKLALSHKENSQVRLMLELPAYLRNAAAILRDLDEWAAARAEKGGAPLQVAIVKGSRLDQERVLSFAYGRDGAATTKAETEARYKQLVHAAIAASPLAITPVIGTHNLFDIAYALLDWGRSGRDGLPPFLFFLGLSNHLGRVLARAGAQVTLAAPVADSKEETASFEAYLLGLINELSRFDGFLTIGHAPEPGSIGWGRMRQHFLAALSGRDAQLAAQETADSAFVGSKLDHIKDRAYVSRFMAAAEAEHERAQSKIPLLLDGKAVDTPLTCIRRSLTAPGQEEYRFTSADYPAVGLALDLARSASIVSASAEERLKQLEQVARLLSANRIALGALLVRDAGFTFEDSEREVRMAIDACLYYAQCARQDGFLDGTQPAPLGVVVVAAGLIHPLYEAVAGIAAAWATGNAIIYKPAANTTMFGAKLAALLAEAGMAPPRLQCLPCLDNEIALKLMTDERVDGVIECVSPELSRKIAEKAPWHTLCCQPAGAASIYISAHGDWRQAIPDIVKSAFRRSGQSPVCPHALFVHASAYDNQAFANALKDAVESLKTEPGWYESAQLGPISGAAGNAMMHQLAEAKEAAWLVAPSSPNPQSLLWKPGVRTGLGAGDLPFLQQAGRLPLIGLVRVEDDVQAAALQNKVSGGQAAAIYSTDADEIAAWKQAVDCANIFVNCCPDMQPGQKPLGALAARQPGIPPLPGGPNFLASLCRWQEQARPQRRGKQRNIPFNPREALLPKPSPDDAMRLSAASDSISYWWENEFGQSRDIGSKPGEGTILSYRPVPMCLRVEKETSDIDLSIALMAALKAGSPIEISISETRPWMSRTLPALSATLREESRDEFVSRFPALAKEGRFVRDCGASRETMSAAAACGLHLSSAPILANGRLELLHYLQEKTETTRTPRHWLP